MVQQAISLASHGIFVYPRNSSLLSRRLDSDGSIQAKVIPTCHSCFDSSSLLITAVTVAAPLSLAAVLGLVQDAPLLVLAVPAGTARAAATPSLPAGGVAKDAVVVDVEVRMPVAVELVPTVGPVVADQFVVAAAGEAVEVALAELVFVGVVAFVEVVVVEVNGQTALVDDALLWMCMKQARAGC